MQLNDLLDIRSIFSQPQVTFSILQQVWLMISNKMTQKIASPILKNNMLSVSKENAFLFFSDPETSYYVSGGGQETKRENIAIREALFWFPSTQGRRNGRAGTKKSETARKRSAEAVDDHC